MRKIIGLFLGIYIVMAVAGCQYPGPRLPSKEQLSSEYVHEMKLEYGLNLIENRMDGGTLSFDFYHYAEVEPLQARFLLHSAAKELLKRMPIHKNHVAITISFIDPVTHQRYKDNKVATVTLQHGRIHYSTFNIETEQVDEVLQEEFVQN